MGLENSGPKAKTETQFSYQSFRDRLQLESFTEAQWEPLRIRLSLLESYMEQAEPAKGKKTVQRNMNNGNQRNGQNSAAKFDTIHLVDDAKVEDTLIGEAGCLKVVDLTDPHLDTAGACALFDLSLAVFIKSTKAPKVIALDEAHNVSSTSSRPPHSSLTQI
jgi:hypothetical protein